MRKNRIYSAKLEGNVATSFLIPLKNRPNYFASGIERTVEVLKWNGKDHIASISKSLFSVDHSRMNLTLTFLYFFSCNYKKIKTS